VRPKVTQERIRDAAHALRPRVKAVRTVYTQTQDLGLDPGEPVKSDLIRRDLSRSDRGPGKREESQHNVTFSEIVPQANLLFGLALQTEIGSAIADYKCHSLVLLSVQAHCFCFLLISSSAQRASARTC
jgi:hypothetical protein